MQRIWRILAVAAVCVALGGAQAMAATWGFYGEYAQGLGKFEFEDYGEDDIDTKALGVGMMVDSNPGNKKGLGFRGTLGVESFDLEVEEVDSLDAWGFAAGGTLTFPLPGSSDTGNYRLWLGLPEVRLGYYTGDYDNHIDTDLFAGSVGVLFGANYFPDPEGIFCISVTLGARLVGYYGQFHTAEETLDADGWGGTGFLNVAFLWE